MLNFRSLTKVKYKEIFEENDILCFIVSHTFLYTYNIKVCGFS